MVRFKTRQELLIAVFVVMAFLFSGWKVGHRPPAGNFLASTPGSREMRPPDSHDLARTSQPSKQTQTGELLLSNGSFVSSMPGQAVHAASLVELKDGRLRAVWFSGSREGSGDVSIKSAVSDAGGAHWGAETTVLDRGHVQKALWRYVKKLGNPVIARGPDGSLYLWVVTVSLGGWAGSSITWARSYDEGNSWTSAQRLVTSPFLNISTLVKGPPFFYENGQLGLPVYHEFLTKFAELLRFDGDGRVVDKVRVPGSRTDLQPVVMVTGAREADVFMRSGRAGSLMFSRTLDSGATWSDSATTAWPNPDAAVAGIVDKDGSKWLVLNPSRKNRQSLAIIHASSGKDIDQGVSVTLENSSAQGNLLPASAYEKILGAQLKALGTDAVHAESDVESAKRQLCNEGSCSEEFSYPYLLQSRDGTIHLVYTWNRARIKHVRISLPRPVPRRSQEGVR